MTLLVQRELPLGLALHRPRILAGSHRLRRSSAGSEPTQNYLPLAFLQPSVHQPSRKGRASIGGLERARTLVSTAGEEKRWNNPSPKTPEKL
jgi:hypothetical protein